MKSLSEENSLEQLIYQPTGIQTVKNQDNWQIQESIIGHVYTSDYRSVKQCGSLQLSHSDHMAIYIRYANIEQKSNSKKIIYKCDHWQYSKSAMAFLCKNEDWSSVFIESDKQKKLQHSWRKSYKHYWHCGTTKKGGDFIKTSNKQPCT